MRNCFVRLEGSEDRAFQQLSDALGAEGFKNADPFFEEVCRVQDQSPFSQCVTASLAGMLDFSLMASASLVDSEYSTRN
jgi:hypothetical protein